MENNGNVDFGGIDLGSLGGDAGEMIEVNVPEAVEAATETPEVASTQQATEDQTIEESGATDENLIEIPDSVIKEDSTTTSEQTPPGEPKTDSPSDAKIATLAKALFQEGVLSELSEEFDGTIEGLFNEVRNEIKNQSQGYINGLPPVIRELAENYQEGVPLDKLISSQSKAIEYSSITDEAIGEDTNLAKKLIRQDLANRGFSEDKIESRIKMFEENEVLIEEAKDAKTALTQLEEYNKEQLKKQTQARRQQEEENNKRTLEDIRKGIDDTTEIVPGISLNKRSRDKIYNSMTQVVGKTEDGRPMNAVMATRQKDPVKFETTLHYLHSLGVFNGDWSKITTASKTDATQELANMLKGNSSEFSGGRNSGHSKPGSSGIMGGLDMFRKENNL